MSAASLRGSASSPRATCTANHRHYVPAERVHPRGQADNASRACRVGTTGGETRGTRRSVRSGGSHAAAMRREGESFPTAAKSAVAVQREDRPCPGWCQASGQGRRRRAIGGVRGDVHGDVRAPRCQTRPQLPPAPAPAPCPPSPPDCQTTAARRPRSLQGRCKIGTALSELASVSPPRPAPPRHSALGHTSLDCMDGSPE